MYINEGSSSGMCVSSPDVEEAFAEVVVKAREHGLQRSLRGLAGCIVISFTSSILNADHQTFRPAIPLHRSRPAASPLPAF